MTDPSASHSSDPSKFISRWRESAASERANYQLFLSELCDVIGVPHPNPSGSDVSKNTYVFERDVKFQNTDGTTSDGRIDLYKQGCFVLEAKQGTEAQDTSAEPILSSTPKRLKKGHGVRGSKGWDDAMIRARGQAEMYAKALPADEGWPPFLIVVDVGHSIELYADFTRSGKTYLQYPDPKSFRLLLSDLENEDLRERLRKVWTDPQSLDPSRRAAKVTRELADRLAKLAKSLEKSGFEPKRVAQFLMRSLFTMFAEDVDLIPRTSFSELLKSLRDDVSNFPDMVRSLWESMDKGQFHPILRKKLRRFNGGLFEDCEALPLTADQLELLIEASQADWRDVEPAIFGTLLERALDERERHKLGAHYTPRAYVERLVLPTLVEPLRADWDAVKAAAYTAARRGEREEAIRIVKAFLDTLCKTRVLDPACGSGNFLTSPSNT
ncbi:MAG: type IIL restriction-modification enzyme MmeI [Planctomycetales bacterium]